MGRAAQPLAIAPGAGQLRTPGASTCQVPEALRRRRPATVAGAPPDLRCRIPQNAVGGRTPAWRVRRLRLRGRALERTRAPRLSAIVVASRSFSTRRHSNAYSSLRFDELSGFMDQAVFGVVMAVRLFVEISEPGRRCRSFQQYQRRQWSQRPPAPAKTTRVLPMIVREVERSSHLHPLVGDARDEHLSVGHHRLGRKSGTTWRRRTRRRTPRGSPRRKRTKTRHSRRLMPRPRATASYAREFSSSPDDSSW